MSIIEELKQKEYHPCRDIFNDFPRAAVAKQLEIEPAYFSSILNGSRVPGKQLNKKICDLADRIERERSANG